MGPGNPYSPAPPLPKSREGNGRPTTIGAYSALGLLSGATKGLGNLRGFPPHLPCVGRSCLPLTGLSSGSHVRLHRGTLPQTPRQEGELPP